MESSSPNVALHVRRFGDFALAGVAFFAIVCIAAQFARSDLDWLRAPLSFYLLGDYGLIVKGAYFVLGATLMLLGIGYYRALAMAARSGAPLLLFVSAGVALDVVALADSDLKPGSASLEAFMHGLAANTAFLCVTTAMLLQAWRLRGDALWRGRFAIAFALAAVCFIAMWVHVLWREAPRGLTQKVVIALILAWLALAASWLRRGASSSVVVLPDRSSEGATP
ncbi:MAG TPA: DUF998 domain-containing protein [Lysobacter sp.]|jgi:hypothetical protein|nr:DUF998 domain-containing protein [Lysobacter sp.]